MSHTYFTKRIPTPPNYDESKIPPYTLPNPLEFLDGRIVKNKEDWNARRKEIVKIFSDNMYGKELPPPEALNIEMLDEGVILGGLGIRRQYRINFKPDGSGPYLDWIVFIPNKIAKDNPNYDGNNRIVCENNDKVPVVLFLNYRGNHTLVNDGEVHVPENIWVRERNERPNHRPLETWRGSQQDTTSSSPFPVETILARGYAVMSCCYGQVSPDVEVLHGNTLDQAWTGVFELWGKHDTTIPNAPTALGAWAWALSRGLDLAEKIPEIDAARSVATGCSRLAKTALLAASRDERFAVCVPCQTGGGGVPLAKRLFGETVATEMEAFPHWYCPEYDKYSNNEAELPFDQHMLLASIAPRALLVEGFNQGWFDTYGEFLSCQAASSAWEVLGLPGLPKGDFPANYDTACIGPKLGYVRRGGAHGLSGIDWHWLLNFADQALK